jgi:hypothetical protein
LKFGECYHDDHLHQESEKIQPDALSLGCFAFGECRTCPDAGFLLSGCVYVEPDQLVRQQKKAGQKTSLTVWIVALLLVRESRRCSDHLDGGFCFRFIKG